jgi:ankyrin repeat protein
VKLLLDKGADVNAKGGYYGNALHAASVSGHEQVVKLLFDEGDDTKSPSTYKERLKEAFPHPYL